MIAYQYRIYSVYASSEASALRITKMNEVSSSETMGLNYRLCHNILSLENNHRLWALINTYFKTNDRTLFFRQSVFAPYHRSRTKAIKQEYILGLGVFGQIMSE